MVKLNWGNPVQLLGSRDGFYWALNLFLNRLTSTTISIIVIYRRFKRKYKSFAFLVICSSLLLCVRLERCVAALVAASLLIRDVNLFYLVK